MKDYKGVALYAAGALTVFVLQWGINALHGTTTDAGAVVFNTCMKAHTETNGASEKACGDAQNMFKYEFICDPQELGGGCWVEKNEQLSE